jgi:hypothetical protein
MQALINKRIENKGFFVEYFPTLNQRVVGSNPTRLTSKFKGFQGVIPENPFFVVLKSFSNNR